MMFSRVSLGEIVSAAAPERAGDTELPVLSMTRAHGLVRQDAVFKKTVASKDLSKYKVVRPAQLVVGIHPDEGAVGVSKAGDLGIVSPAYTIWSIRDLHRVDPSYLDRFIRSPPAVSYFNTHYRKTADRRGKLTREQFLALEVPLPSVEEQRRIAAVLDAADALRAKRRQALAKLETLTQATFIDMFVRRADPAWMTLPVEELADPTPGSIRTGPFGSQLLHEEFSADGPVAVLGIDNAVQNRFVWGERRFISDEKYQELKRYTVRAGDVLVTIMGTCGRVAIVPEDVPVAINTKHLCCITLDEDRCRSEYLWACLRFHPDVLRQLGATRGAVMPGLNMGLIKQAKIPVPPLELQAEFSQRKRQAERQVSRLERNAVALDDLFASLQQRAFRGEL